MDNNDTESVRSESFTESVSDEHYHDSVEGRNNDNPEYSDAEDEANERRSQRRMDLVLDLRNVPPIANIVKSDDETSEKLSAVIEQSEEEPRMPERTFKDTESHEDSEEILRERISTLRDVITALREQIRLEVTLWRKEHDEYHLLRERGDIHALEEATSAARAAAEAYAAESPLSNELGDVVDLNPVQSLSELTILEYERKLAKYQDALALAQAEKRYNMRRQLIANTYRQRLVEVERLCNEELENIRKSANTLQPLRQMASQWCMNEDGNYGDACRESVTMSLPMTMPYKCSVQPTETTFYDQSTVCKTSALEVEVNMVPETSAGRFSYAESFKYDRHSGVRTGNASQTHILGESNSLPSNWYAPTSNC